MIALVRIALSRPYTFALSRNEIDEARLFDEGKNFIRPQLATVQGAAIPSPYGGKVRQVQVDLNLHALLAYNLSPEDVVSALTAGNIILPARTEKIGPFEYAVDLNASPRLIDELNDIPIKAVNQAAIGGLPVTAIAAAIFLDNESWKHAHV